MPLFRHFPYVVGPDDHSIKEFHHAECLSIQETSWVTQQVHDTLVGALNLLQLQVLFGILQECSYIHRWQRYPWREVLPLVNAFLVTCTTPNVEQSLACYA